MNKSLLLKIAGFITVPLLVMVVAMFFLYPYINEEGYQKLVDEQEQKMEAELQPMAPADIVNNVDSAFVINDSLKTDSIQVVDSLAYIELGIVQAENAKLHSMVDSLMVELEKFKTAEDERNQNNPIEELSQEEFSQRVKSLLNLEEDDLAPILEKMTNDQLVRLYNGGGTIQREKILRSLNSKKAAKLMSEIML